MNIPSHKVNQQYEVYLKLTPFPA